ncbi:MAG: hypothetical protein WAW92_01235 [Minisyncoccia bacterium]
MKNILYRVKDSLKFLRSNKISYENRGLNPSKDWSFMFLVANALVLFYAIYAFYIYNQINNDEFITKDSVKNESEIKLNTNLLSSVVSDINKRASNLKVIRNGNGPGDPSL